MWELRSRRLLTCSPSGIIAFMWSWIPALAETFFTANYELLVLALRNLHENAVHHMPSGGTVRWHVKHERTKHDRFGGGRGSRNSRRGASSGLLIAFFRGRHKSASGSGLGLAIVELALRANGASLNLANRTTAWVFAQRSSGPARSGYFSNLSPQAHRSGNGSGTYSCFH